MSKGKAPERRGFGDFIRDLFRGDSDEHRDRRPNQNNASSSRSRDLPPSYQDAVASRKRLQNGRIKEAVERLTRDGMDPIVASAYWNQTQSPLVRLPDALMVAIMERLDLHDILRLRHVSRDFMRLFSQSKAFWKYHLTEAHNKAKRTKLARVWATPLERFPAKHLQSLASASLCGSCIAFRKRKGYESDRELIEDVPFVYCAGCKMEHRAFYFSAQQRHESNDDDRICRGREGCISLCEHVSITWDLAQRMADARPSGQTSMVECHHEHHKVSPCQHVKNTTPKLCCHNDKPRIIFYRDENRKLCFDMSISTHLPFKQQRFEQGNRVSSTAFRSSIAKLVRERLPSSSFQWAPSNYASSNVLKCFDPNISSCLDWGQSRLPRRLDVQSATTTDKFEWKLCPNPQRPWRLRPKSKSRTFTGSNEFQREHQDRCAGFAHNRHADSLDFSWDWGWESCSDDKEFLVFTQTVRSRVSFPHHYGWSRFIKFKSYSLTKDDEMHGISWCSQSSCRFFAAYAIETKFRYGHEQVVHHRARSQNPCV
ncbi:hypothetical protein BKA56DRAFT_668788 [Ilyonectria sp. MPI-CAGE-AT-0026]|nr:hypothetical protein BKA56DRAFT_668788 [Ilyonectria sp. MPI-CAGE-AT-0026]